MPDLMHALQGNDLGFLRMVANAWGFELSQPDSYTALPALVNNLSNKTLAHEIVEALPTEARTALEALYENQGMLPWQVFVRRFGEVRVMGAGRRDRERPDLSPISPAEILWYRALICKAFFNTPPEPQEYAYIPDDLLEILQPVVNVSNRPLGRPASPVESAFCITSDSRILDDACTLLAALRTGTNLPEDELAVWKTPYPILIKLLQNARLIDAHKTPRAENIRQFLEAPRSEALAALARAWLRSKEYNDLKMLAGLKFEGNWVNDPLLARQTIIAFINALPSATWWNTNAFINAIREQFPDFQRPAGDYDSWFIFQEESQSYLRGFESWNEVEGALIRFMINGPLHWLGFLDLAAPAEDKGAEAFRPSSRFKALLSDKSLPDDKAENGSIRLAGDGTIQLPRLSPRSLRYQIARFALFETHIQDIYKYRITASAIERAHNQGLKPSQLIALLRKYSNQPLPPPLIQALERWEKLGTQSRLEKLLVLRANPEIIQTLQQNKSLKRYLGDMLGSDAIIIKNNGQDVVFRALLEAGYLLDVSLE